MNYKELSYNDRELFTKYIDACPQKTADFTFINLLVWNNLFNYSFLEKDNLLWLKNKENTQYAPLGDWNSIDFTKIDCLKKGMSLHRVPERLKDILSSQFKENCIVEEDPSNDEYLYNREDLAHLKGNKYSKKRNHINKFLDSYTLDYREFDHNLSDEMKAQILDLQEKWCKANDCKYEEILFAEFVGTKYLFENIEKFPSLRGGALFDNSKLIAFTLGEKLDDKTFVVHFEKADANYLGVYQVINKNFILNTVNDFVLINREQDLGLQGLRQAKHSYYPVDFLRKFTVSIKPHS